MQENTADALRDHLSPARFAMYRDCTRSDTKALELYMWNTALSGSIYEALGLVEVFLRNAIDRQLQEWNTCQPSRAGEAYDTDWVRRPAKPLYMLLNPKPRNGGKRRSTYEGAHTRALQDTNARDPSHPRHGAAVTHDDVVAHMTFGTWVKLLPRFDGGDRRNPQLVLWNQAIAKAFPHQPDPLVIKFWADRVHQLRNRVAHLERLTATDVKSYHRTCARLLRAIDPVAGDWYSGTSRIPATLRLRPTG